MTTEEKIKVMQAKGLKIRDILDLNRDYPCIAYRCNNPFWNDDMLFGYASYKAGSSELTSEDGDSYSLDDEIYAYTIDDDTVTVWVEVKWSK